MASVPPCDHLVLSAMCGYKPEGLRPDISPVSGNSHSHSRKECSEPLLRQSCIVWPLGKVPPTLTYSLFHHWYSSCFSPPRTPADRPEVLPPAGVPHDWSLLSLALAAPTACLLLPVQHPQGFGQLPGAQMRPPEAAAPLACLCASSFLQNFYKSEINKEEMYIRYIHKLCDMHLQAENYTGKQEGRARPPPGKGLNRHAQLTGESSELGPARCQRTVSAHNTHPFTPCPRLLCNARWRESRGNLPLCLAAKVLPLPLPPVPRI